MPDNSKRSVYQTGLPGGRKPSGIRPQVPYRIEEWGKSRGYLLTADAAARLSSLKYPVSAEEYARAAGPMTPKRGPPSCGSLVVFVGEQTEFPLRNQTESGLKVRVVESGFVQTKKEAWERLDAYIRRRQLAQTGKVRRRAKARQGVGVRMSGSGSASRAKSGSRVGKPGT